jgi:hypothetical protein
VKHVWLLLVCASCVDDTAEPWQLARDRVVAVRMTPPGIASGEVAQMEGLIAHADGPTTVEMPRGATAAGSELFTAVHYNLGHWEIEAPALDAPVSLEVTLQFAGSLYATKSITLGEHRDNPPDPVTMLPDEVVLAPGRDQALYVETTATDRVRWYTSCGDLVHAEQVHATLRASDAACTGELVVVVRDDAGGVSWRVWPLRVE